MELETLTAISPIDGRYRNKVEELVPYFSELALMRYRLKTEVEYFIALTRENIAGLDTIPESLFPGLRSIYENFTLEDGRRIKEIERTTNHDVKAVEYFLKDKMDALDPRLHAAREYIHFGLTSQDVNNTALPMMLRDAIHEQFLPGCRALQTHLETLADSLEGIAMLARTHGQPASPTTVGKEIRVFAVRLRRQLDELATLPYPGKFGGATGNFNAHTIAFPDRDWHAFADRFLRDTLGLERSYPTTQIEHYDGLARIFDNVRRINTVLTDLCIDIWLYISSEYFRQKTVAHEVGSSAMPHKVNPIDFENAEGNLGFSTAMLEFLSRKLPVSRLQRDLTDSTITRNIGVSLAHAWLAVQSIRKGLGKLEVNREKLRADLEANWAVVAEALQTILRRIGYPNPYERLKDLTRGKTAVTEADIRTFIQNLDVTDAVKAELAAVTPWNYTGQA